MRCPLQCPDLGNVIDKEGQLLKVLFKRRKADRVET